MGVGERQAAHRRPAHVDVEDAPARGRRTEERLIRIGGLREADELWVAPVATLVDGYAPARVVVLGLANHRVLRLDQLVMDRDGLR